MKTDTFERSVRHPAISLPLIALALAGCGEKNAFVPPPPPQVDVQTPDVRTVTTYTEFPGTTTAFQNVEVRARVKGILEEIKFEPGDRVAAGDVLFVIEKAPFLAAQKVAQGRVAAAEADLKLAETELARKAEAVAKQAISKLDHETSIGKRDAAGAALDIAKAELDNAELDLEYTDVTAPLAGKASKNFVDIGNLVGATEATLLTTLVNDTEVFANFEVNERAVIDYLRLREERLTKGVSKAAAEWALKLRLADGEIYEQDGKANFFDNVLDPDSGSVRARALFPNPKGHLLGGLFVRVMIPQTVADAIMVPRQAIGRDLDGFFVLVVGAGDIVERRIVIPGAVVDANLQIVARRNAETEGGTGLDGDERVIVRGFQRAREGSKVAPQTPAKKAPAADAPEGAEPAA